MSVVTFLFTKLDHFVQNLSPKKIRIFFFVWSFQEHFLALFQAIGFFFNGLANFYLVGEKLSNFALFVWKTEQFLNLSVKPTIAKRTTFWKKMQTE